ncbi:uncharacterized protein BKCO1_9000169 [Diplodia corticola]|uniref:Uncharacterized protein n=1 Tax=Diplodia corticola TaxID=236234 RepID=A0A1J9R9F8_9PEZI|nr:uncharacterized protein BKCO1_9000169 [Diplodia corticola]OJD36818.1 hypothetical protein BKCO1_9000169 [Diplodia corticola]
MMAEKNTISETDRTGPATKNGYPVHGSPIIIETSEEPDMERFTAAGRPKPDYQPGISNMDCGSFTGSGAPNLLPVRFTDKSMINVPIPAADLWDGSEPVPQPNERRSSWIAKLGKKLGTKEKQKIVNVKMTRGEYLKYWAKDEDGNYVGTEPRGEGKRIWREKLEAERNA